MPAPPATLRQRHAASTSPAALDSTPPWSPVQSRPESPMQSPDSAQSSMSGSARSKSAWSALVAALLSKLLSRRRRQSNNENANAAAEWRSPVAQRRPLPIEPQRRRGSKVLYTIMADPVMLDMFEKHLAQEFGTESMFFLDDTAEWIHSYHDVPPALRLVRARKIFKTYVDHNSPFAINVPSHCSAALQHALHEAEVDRSVFDDARCEVARLLERGAVARFVVSSAYKEGKAVRASSSSESLSPPSPLSLRLAVASHAG